MKKQCDLCGYHKAFGGGVYDGKPSAYDSRIFFCNNCRRVHWDGIGPHHEKKFAEVLSKYGLDLPARNEKGWYPMA